MADDDQKQDWLQHPHTQSCLKTAKQFQQKTLAALLDVCRTSSDPRVTAMVTKYDDLGKMSQVFEKGA